MEEEDAYLREHMPPPMQKKRDLETIAKKKNEQKKRRIRMAFAAKNVKTPVEDIPATGPGPWKVFMLINVHANEATKKQVEIRLHTYPQLVANVKNRLDQGAWVIVAMLGDFYLFEGILFSMREEYRLNSSLSRRRRPANLFRVVRRYQGPHSAPCKGICHLGKVQRQGPEVVNDRPYPRGSEIHHCRAPTRKHATWSHYRQGGTYWTRTGAFSDAKGETRIRNRKTQAKIKKKRFSVKKKDERRGLRLSPLDRSSRGKQNFISLEKDGARRLWQMLQDNFRVPGTRRNSHLRLLHKERASSSRMLPVLFPDWHIYECARTQRTRGVLHHLS
jgi:hypothetical protein